MKPSVPTHSICGAARMLHRAWTVELNFSLAMLVLALAGLQCLMFKFWGWGVRLAETVLAKTNFWLIRFWPKLVFQWFHNLGSPKGVGPRRVGAPKGGGPKCRPFFPSPAPFFALFCLSLGLLVEFWWCLKCRGSQVVNVHI